MRKVYFIFFSFLIINNLIAQSDKTSEFQLNKPNLSESDEVVLTPMGPMLKSKIHFVDSKHHLNIKDGHIQVINTKTGKVSREFDNILNENTNKDKKNILSKLKSKTSTFPSDSSGWITDADWYNNDTIMPISYFSTSWIVPSPPATDNGQTIFLFNGLSPSSCNYILQPVLQWGISAAGGSNYWAIANWFVTSSTDCFVDSLIQVTPGTKLQGVMKLTSESGDTSFSYNSSFTGYPTGTNTEEGIISNITASSLDSGLQVNNLTQPKWAFETLEVYGITGCADYPADSAVKMSDIQIKTDSIYPSLTWTPMDAATECGQHTTIVSNSSDSGEVDIYFQNPCSGIPNPGNTVSSANPVCTSYPFTLSLQNAIPGGDVHYQWQSSPDSSEWSNISGAINAVLDTSQTVSAWYRCKVACSADTGISTPLRITMTNNPLNCYCLGTYDTCGSIYDIDITNVTFRTINNTTAGYCNPPYSYIDYTGLSTTVTQGLSYPISISSNFDGNSIYWGIWVDWNNSGSFTDNADKYTVIHNRVNRSVTGTGTIVVPAGAAVGNHRMRIRANYYSDPGQTKACSNLDVGEQEDYTVNVIAATGINTINNNTSIINVYPNPAKNEITIEILQKYKKTFEVSQNLEILNSICKVVYKANITDKIIVNVSGFAEGIYIVRLFSDQSSYNKKLEVKR